MLTLKVELGNCIVEKTIEVNEGDTNEMVADKAINFFLFTSVLQEKSNEIHILAEKIKAEEEKLIDLKKMTTDEETKEKLISQQKIKLEELKKEFDSHNYKAKVFK